MTDNATNEAMRNQLEWILKTTDDSLKNVSKKVDRFKLKASIIKIITLVSGAILTLLLGLQFPESVKLTEEVQLIMRMAAFSLAVFVTLLNAFEPFFNFRALWVEHEEANYKLHMLKRDIQFYANGIPNNDISHETIEDFNHRLNHIWAELSEKWISHRRAGDVK